MPTDNTAPLPLDGSDWLIRLRDHAASLETTQDWPRESLRLLAEAGVLRRGIPTEFGGIDQSYADLLRDYIALSDACMVTTFVLTQRQAAVQRIIDADAQAPARAELLPPLASGELFATVGISHLTTSRQHWGRPAVVVRTGGSDLILSGDIPWVTGGVHADVIVTGGVSEQGQQYLIALPTDVRGVTCHPPERLLALSASATSGVSLQEVRVPADRVLSGPVERVIQRGSGTGSLGTSALAVGLSQRAIRLLEAEAERRPDLVSIHHGLHAELDRLRHDLLQSAEGATGVDCGSPESLRERANALALRSTQALLTASKGAGFVAGHPAERAVREAMFFLVWSCPQPVVAAALRGFACLVPG